MAEIETTKVSVVESFSESNQVMSNVAQHLQAIDDIAATIEKNISDCFENNRKLMINHVISTLTECGNDINAAYEKNKAIISFDDVLKKECQVIIDGFRDRMKSWKKGTSPVSKKIISKENKNIAKAKGLKKKKIDFFVKGDSLVVSTRHHNNYIPLESVKAMFNFVKDLDHIHMKSFKEALSASLKSNKESNYCKIVIPKVKSHHAYYSLEFFKKFKLIIRNGAGIYKVKNKNLKDLNEILLNLTKNS